MITQTIEAYLQTNVIDSSDVQEYSNSAWFSQVIMFEFLDKFFNKDVPQDNVLLIGGMTDRNKFMYLSYPNNLSFCYTAIFKAKFLNDELFRDSKYPGLKRDRNFVSNDIVLCENLLKL